MKFEERLLKFYYTHLFSYNNLLDEHKDQFHGSLGGYAVGPCFWCQELAGAGSGMNSTVIAEIWKNLEGDIDTAFGSGASTATKQAFCKDLPDRLKALWHPAWNVVVIVGDSQADTVLYGYAFNNQWMWCLLPLSAEVASSSVWLSGRTITAGIGRPLEVELQNHLDSIQSKRMQS